MAAPGPNNILPASTILNLVNNGWFNFNNGSDSQTVAGLTGDATGKVSVTNGTSTNLLTIDPAAGQSYTFSGVIGPQTILSKVGGGVSPRHDRRGGHGSARRRQHLHGRNDDHGRHVASRQRHHGIPRDWIDRVKQ